MEDLPEEHPVQTRVACAGPLSDPPGGGGGRCSKFVGVTMVARVTLGQAGQDGLKPTPAFTHRGQGATWRPRNSVHTGRIPRPQELAGPRGASQGGTSALPKLTSSEGRARHPHPPALPTLTVSPRCPGCPGSPSLPGGPCRKQRKEASSHSKTRTFRASCHPRGQKLPFHFQGDDGQVTVTSTAGRPGSGHHPLEPSHPPGGHCRHPRGEAKASAALRPE